MVKALVIVAHPDDETIWMGGTILKNKDWEWTIVSLCRKEDLDRAPKFMKVCGYYNAEGIISDLDDEKLEPLNIKNVVNKIKEVVPYEEYDFVFTHGENGEYEHIRHVEIHRAVEKMFSRGGLKCGKLKFFSYKIGDIYVENNTDINLLVPDVEKRVGNENVESVDLSEEIFKRKVAVVKDMYGFDEKSFEVVNCGKTECFRLV